MMMRRARRASFKDTGKCCANRERKNDREPGRGRRCARSGLSGTCFDDYGYFFIKYDIERKAVHS